MLLICLFCWPPISGADEGVLDYFKKEFPAGENRKIKENTSGADGNEPRRTVSERQAADQKASEDIPCPPHVPDYVCSIMKYFKPLPFTPEEEKKSRTDPVIRNRVREGLIGNIQSFENHIRTASRIFDVPVPIIISVINTESGGNPAAKNPRSSAKGLMQTIDSTFRLAQKRIREDYRIAISNPYDPQSSIFAGTWYLSYVYDWAARKKPELRNGKDDLNNWRKALMNYYLGPDHEKYLKGKVIVYPNGHVEKLSSANRYVSKIMTFAETISG